MCWVSVCARKQTDQTTTLCVQEVEIYLERWEVLGALVDVCRARAHITHLTAKPSRMIGVQVGVVSHVGARYLPPP